MDRPLPAVLLLCLAGCANQKPAETKKAGAPPPVPVTVATAALRSVPVELTAIGNVQAYSTVSVKAMVGGEITTVAFEEGQDVKQGQVLFTIDPRPFQAALKQAEANLARDTAQAENAEADARRYEQLFQSGVVAAEKYEQMRAQAKTYRAMLDADRAAIETARLNLQYTTILSPLDGRTGSLLIHRGNVVKANDLPLVVINQIQPVYVAFSVPAQHLDAIKKSMAGRRLKVRAIPKDGNRPVDGELSFIDNTVDVNTATITLKGTFANPDRSLWPGQFVDVVLTLGSESNAVVAPSQAVQSGQQGEYVFVVKPDRTVEPRPVRLGRAAGNDIVIEQGLRAGEVVVTDGQLRLAPGARIQEVKRGQGATP
jgi:multidrug efflux system membrane fusion protein